MGDDDEFDLSLGTQSSAKPLLKPSNLQNAYFFLPSSNSCTGGLASNVFLDKKLPQCAADLTGNKEYNVDYYVSLHKLVSAQGGHYPAGTSNYLGARIP